MEGTMACVLITKAHRGAALLLAEHVAVALHVVVQRSQNLELHPLFLSDCCCLVETVFCSGTKWACEIYERRLLLSTAQGHDMVAKHDRHRTTKQYRHLASS